MSNFWDQQRKRCFFELIPSWNVKDLQQTLGPKFPPQRWRKNSPVNPPQPQRCGGYFRCSLPSKTSKHSYFLHSLKLIWLLEIQVFLGKLLFFPTIGACLYVICVLRNLYELMCYCLEAKYEPFLFIPNMSLPDFFKSALRIHPDIRNDDSLEKTMSNPWPFWRSNLRFSKWFRQIQFRPVKTTGRPHRPLRRTHAPANIIYCCYCHFIRKGDSHQLPGLVN